MRLWTLHPAFLDPAGLVALWREALLAQKVLRGLTRGYRHHPQLTRFRAARDPVGALADYLRVVHAEARRRGYAFDGRKISRRRGGQVLAETSGQLRFEWGWLMTKLRRRDPDRWRALSRGVRPRAHPLFRIRAGRVRSWERGRG